ncbi:MAG: hypothetical protein L3K26_10730 [Candidatus Hydrogenedentes bacterium]|nr:hypothetical protein [Candidatus Hydrogenedentota bacterium]
MSRRPEYPKFERDKDGGMVMSSDNRSMQRGRRGLARTEVCRPSLVWSPDAPDEKMEGVVLDLNPRGLRMRMVDEYPTGTLLMVQLMRDEEFQVPLSQPLTVLVVHTQGSSDGFYDHGMMLQIPKIKRAGFVRPIRVSRPNVRLGSAQRMFTAAGRNPRRGR